MDVVLKYCMVPLIIENSLLKRTMKVGNLRFPAICESAGWMTNGQLVVFNVRYI